MNVYGHHHHHRHHHHHDSVKVLEEYAAEFPDGMVVMGGGGQIPTGPLGGHTAKGLPGPFFRNASFQWRLFFRFDALHRFNIALAHLISKNIQNKKLPGVELS